MGDDAVRPRVFASPGRYVQGVGTLDQLGDYVGRIGERPFLIADDIVWGLVGERVTASFERAGLGVHRAEFSGLATVDTVETLSRLARDSGADVVVGIGGGSAIDTAKAVGSDSGARWASVPTTASTDAPTSSVAVLYSAAGAMQGVRILPHAPDLVLIDSQVVADAPVSFLVAGIGDAIATWLEARLSSRTGSLTPNGGLATDAALALAELSWHVLHEHALPAIEAVRDHVVDDHVEKVIEANTLLSGLGFESGGLGAAHAIHDGLTTVAQTHGLQHGQKVNVGSVAQLILEGRPTEEIDEFIVFTTAVGLPTCLTEVGLSPEDTAELERVAAVATGPRSFIHALPYDVTPQHVVDALIATEEATRRARSRSRGPEPERYHPRSSSVGSA